MTYDQHSAITYTVSFERLPEQLVSDYRKAFRGFEAAKQSIIKAARELPEASAAIALIHSHLGRMFDKIDIDSYNTGVKFTATSMAPSAAVAYLPEKVVNSLINGKLLTDDEKRELLNGMYGLNLLSRSEDAKKSPTGGMDEDIPF